MGVRRLTRRTARALVGLFAAWTLMVAGIWVEFGLGWALLAAGVELGAYLLVIYDVDEAEASVAPAVPLRTLRDIEAEEDEG